MSAYYANLEAKIFGELRAKIAEEIDFQYLEKLELVDYKPKYDNFSDAVLNGDLLNMKWLKANCCDFHNRTFSHAAKFGNLDNMKWLKENGCPFDDWTFSSAVEFGNLDNMKWLKDNGCPFGINTFFLCS